MILRDAVLSDSRVPLEVGRRERVVIDVPAEALSPRATSILQVPAPLRAVVDNSSPPPAPVIIEPEPPSLDLMLEWLQTCSVADRAAVVEFLADDVQALRAAARADAASTGHAEGVAQAAAQAERTLSSLESLASAAESAFDGELQQLAEQCAEVAVTALCKIAGPLLASSDGALAAVLEVLKRVKEEREIVIRVAAVDLPVLRAAQERIARALAGRRFSIVEDERVVCGGCLVESKLGSLDGRLDLQLRALGETIRAAKLTAVERQ